MTAIKRFKPTGFLQLDERKPGDIVKDVDGNIYDVVQVIGPELSSDDLKRLRRAAHRINATSHSFN